ncbi:MAG: DNA-3-methyladenine glycosylase [Actinomycetota bacterium]|nr:DNA-3-methyladenine glycosylase [Actinomycetota bacterium]
MPPSTRESSGEARRARPLPRRFYDRDARIVAPELLNKVLVHGRRRGRIVEVEAYVGDGTDPGSHAHRGPTPRNASMFGSPGHLYVYFTYGMHWCCNAVCDPVGTASAVLLRAVEPLAGMAELRAARPVAGREVDLANGPAKLCQAFGIAGCHDGIDLARPTGGGPTIVDDGFPPPNAPLASRRIGLSAGADLPWRWCVPASPYVSRPTRSPATVTSPGGSRGSSKL